MIENNLLSYLNIGLPEDILRMKLHGDFDGAVRLIDRKLSDPALPDPLRYCLMAEREMILRMPSDYPFTREDALKKIRTRIPDFTEDEFDHYLSIGQIRWIYVNGEMRIFDRFFESMCKSMPDFRKRTAVTLDGSESAGKGSRGDLRLNRAMEIMKEKGSLSNRIRIRASVKVKDSAFTPEMFVRVHLPIPAACDQQSDIRIESVFPENAKIAPEDAPQRTICWEETLKENHEFSVQYSYVHTAVWHDTESALKKSDACKTFGTEVNPGTVSQEQTLSAGLNHKAAETVQLYAHSSNESSSSSLREFEVGVSDDLAELAPHIVFTPYIRALAAELSKGCDKLEVPESSLPEYPIEKTPDFDDFDGDELGNFYYSPRIMPQRFADINARKGYVRIRGQESRTSLNKVSILARKLTSVYARITTKMEFVPEVHQHSAGLILYYDNMNYINLRKYYSETLGQSALSIIHLENGVKTEFLNTRIPVEDKPIYLRLYIEGRKSWFEWSYDGENYEKIGRIFDTTRFSDEYCKYGEFTGTMVGLTCADRILHRKCADFDFFEYKADESRMVE